MRITKNKFYKFAFSVIFSAVFMYALLVFMGIIHITPPWKVINPDDPSFDPMRFNFYDYDSGKASLFEETCEIVKKIITIGTSQDNVEYILVESGDAYKIRDDEFRRSYLNPVNAHGLIPNPIILNNYQVQIIVVVFDQDRLVNEISCRIKQGPWAAALFNLARKKGKYNGENIHR